MKLKLLFFLLITQLVHAQTVIPAVYNSGITADGIVSANEWALSSSITIQAPGNPVTCKVAYDSTRLCLLYYGKLETANMLFPEVLLDVNNSKSAAWESDDWWLHVSATDCESQGAYGVYNNCAAVQPGWTGVPNFSPGQPITDTVEIVIPWIKSGFDPFSGNDLGISLLVTNTFSSWYGWPAGYNRNQPSSWGILDFTVNTTALQEQNVPTSVQFFPNPSAGAIHVTTKNCGNCMLRITNQLGQLKFESEIKDPGFEIELKEKGIYFAAISDANGRTVLCRKLVVSQ